MLVCLVAGGDSITFNANSYIYQFLGIPSSGVFALSGNYTTAAQLATCTYLKGVNNIICRNIAVPGTRLNTNGFPDLVPLAPAYIDALVAPSNSVPPRKYVFCNFIGSNDGALGGLANTTAYAAAVQACNTARKSAGYVRTTMCTLLPRNDGVLLEVNRLSYNALITGAGWAAANGIDAIVDLASEPTMGNPATCADTTYYLDGVHPTQVGFALLTPIFTAVMNGLIAGL